MNCNLRLGWSEEVKPVLFVVRRYVQQDVLLFVWRVVSRRARRSRSEVPVKEHTRVERLTDVKGYRTWLAS